MLYPLRLVLNLLTFFTASFLLFYIYVRTWQGQASVTFKVCSVFITVMYILSLHSIIFTFALITILNILTTYIFVVYSRFSKLFTLSQHDEDNIARAF